MSLSAEQRASLEWMTSRSGTAKAAPDELDRLQATADRRGELLRRALFWLDNDDGPLAAAIVAELAGEGDGS